MEFNHFYNMMQCRLVTIYNSTSKLPTHRKNLIKMDILDYYHVENVMYCEN